MPTLDRYALKVNRVGKDSYRSRVLCDHTEYVTIDVPCRGARPRDVKKIDPENGVVVRDTRPYI